MIFPGAMKFFRANAWLVAVWVCTLVGYAAMSLTFGRGKVLITFGDLALTLLPLVAIASLLMNAATPYRRTNSFWILFGAGCGLFLVGQLVWTYYELVLDRPSGYTAASNFFFFMHLVPFMAALALQPHAQGLRKTLRFGFLDLALLAGIWICVYAFLALPWKLAWPNQELYSERDWQAFMGENLVYSVALILVWLRARGPWRTVYSLLLAAEALHALGFSLIFWKFTTAEYFSGCILDLPYVAMFLCYATAGIVAHRLTLQPEPAAPIRDTQWPARLAMGAILSMPLFAVWNALLSTAPPEVKQYRLLLVMFTILSGTALVFWRQHLLDRERLKLVQELEDSVENLRRLQTQYVQTEKLASLGQLAAGAAHELNNPLAAILGFADLLSTDESAGPRIRGVAEKILEQARRTRSLVADLLSFARQVPAERQLLDLKVVIANALEPRAHELEAKNVRLQIEAPTVLPAVRGDPNQLLQVLYQLVSNAMDAMEPHGGGGLKIRAFCEKATVVLELSDSGIGLEEPKRVFDPFYTTKPVGKGTGLGLSICYGIIREHGGQISCANCPEGGAVFRIELPAVLALLPRASVSSAATRAE